MPLSFPTTARSPPPAGWPGCQVQNLHYTYDPVGNITHIRDDAQQTIYFKNKRVEPSAEYRYDAIYRLIEATGREHLGQNVGGNPLPPTPTSPTDVPRVGLLHPGDGQAMGVYLQQYVYDEVGNILVMRHYGTDPSHPGWKRCYQYAVDSNRLLSTGGPKDLQNPVVEPDTPCPHYYAPTPVYPEHYDYDAHGNMTRMPHLTEMDWDFKDQLQMADLGGGGKAYYVYDAAGQRVRKVHEHNGATVEERIYLGGFEIYRKRNASGLKLERETLHIMDSLSRPEGGNPQRIALVETKTADADNPAFDPDSPTSLTRYQLGNHLGSACLELDAAGEVITYEEYYPYGSTAYRAVNKNIKAAAKRYRYTGKEQDEESGLYYFGARYYAAWLGRWTSTDKKLLEDSLNLFEYVSSNPVKYYDLDGNGKATLVTKPLKEIMEWTARKGARKTGQKLYGGTRRISQREWKKLAKKLGLPDIPTGTKLSKKELLKLLEEETAKGVIKRGEVHKTIEAASKELGSFTEEALGVKGAEGTGSVVGVLASVLVATRTKKGIKRLLGGGAGALFIALSPDISKASGGIEGVRVDEYGIHLVQEVEVSNWFGWFVDILDVTRTYEARFTITHEGVVRDWAFGGSLGRVVGRIEMTQFEEGGEGELSSASKEDKSGRTSDDGSAQPSVTIRIGEISYKYPAPWLHGNQEETLD